MDVKKVSANFKNFFNSKVGSLRALSGTIMLLAFIVLVVLEVLVIQSGIRIAFSAKQTPPDFKPAKGVRVDFEAYKFGETRVNNSVNFEPLPKVEKNPFAPQ